jgi:Tol biopolymer transport system component
LHPARLSPIALFGPLIVAAVAWLSPASAVRAAEPQAQEFSVDNLPAVAPAFSPDGKYVVFGRSVGKGIFIFISERSGDTWGPAKVAPFSGVYRDLEPTFAPSGKYLVFASNRPLQTGGKLADGNYDGQLHPESGGHLWRVERNGDRWADPQPLPVSVNASDSIFSPSITGDGSLYFMRPVNAGEKFHLFRAQMKNGVYESPQRVAFSNLEAFGDFDPAVSKDDRFLIFSSPRPPAPAHQSDLFIVYRRGGEWSEPMDLRESEGADVYGVEARLDPLENTLYFTNGRKLPSDSADDKTRVVHSWKVSLSDRGSAQAQSVASPASTLFAYPWASGESRDEPPTSTPDGRTRLFQRSDAHTSKIFESDMIDGSWSPPVVASFSGSWFDQFPAMSPDGSYLIFESNRPASDGAAERLSNLWRVDRTSSGWSVPVRLPATVNISKRIYGHSVAANGDIYFMSSTEPSGKDAGWRLFLAARAADGYAQAEALPFSDGFSSDVDPYIAPDQSYLIFASRNRREPIGQEHLFIAFHHGADWGPIIPIRYQGDEEAKNDDSINVSPDGKILYFESSRGGKSTIWALPLAPYLSAAAAPAL